MNLRYTTVSQPDSVDGWLAMQLSDKLWFPCWDIATMTATAARIAPIIAAQECQEVAPSTVLSTTTMSSSPHQGAIIASQSSGTNLVKDIAVDSVMNASSVSASLCGLLFWDVGFSL